jgi:hypothetical protein
VIAIPERLEERVREAEEEHVVHRPLPEVVVDPKDRRLVEGSQQDPVQQIPRDVVEPEALAQVVQHLRCLHRLTSVTIPPVRRLRNSVERRELVVSSRSHSKAGPVALGPAGARSSGLLYPG